jgi:hypothetical protein
MADAELRVCLVTPVWNDASRLAEFGARLAEALAAAEMPIHWVIGDDGSVARERDHLAELRDQFATVYPQVELHHAHVHRGKGAVVREAWSLHLDDDFLAFIDADGSASPEDLFQLIRTAIRSDSTVLGVRKRTAETQVVESLWRGIAHRLFLTAVHWILGLRAEDPQCGLKVLRGADYRKVEPQLVEIGLAFDSELLAALHHAGFSWVERPISWVEKGDGKVRPLRDGWGMLATLWRVRRRLRQG